MTDDDQWQKLRLSAREASTLEHSLEESRVHVSTDNAYRMGYCAGASKERVRAQKLVEALEYIAGARNRKCQDEKCTCVFDTAHLALAAYKGDANE